MTSHLKPTPTATVVAASEVTFRYDRAPVLEQVSLEVCAGEFVALVGPNGSGKSTLIRLLLGLESAEHGTVELFGSSPNTLRDRGRIGYVPQHTDRSHELPVSVEEVVMGGRLGRGGWWRRRSADDRRAVDHALTTVSLKALRSEPIHHLSGGQLQRVFIARALASEPELLILDEPTAGVDVETQAQFRSALLHLQEHHGAAILLVTHELGAVAGDLDRVIVLKRSVLFDGTPAQLEARGVSLGVHRHDLPLWLEDLE